MTSRRMAMAPPTRARWGLFVSAAVVTLVAAACGSSSTTTSGTSGGGPVKIGYFGALTGNNSPQLGININNGVKLAVQQYNAKGGGPKVTLVEYDKGIADIVASTLPKSGATVPVRDHIDPKATDYSATINGINAGNIDAVFYGGYYQQAGPLVKQLRDAGNKATFVSDDGTNDP